jgi:hypothetical protein
VVGPIPLAVAGLNDANGIGGGEAIFSGDGIAGPFIRFVAPIGLQGKGRVGTGAERNRRTGHKTLGGGN